MISIFVSGTHVKREVNQMDAIWIYMVGRFGGRVGSLVSMSDPGISTAAQLVKPTFLLFRQTIQNDLLDKTVKGIHRRCCVQNVQLLYRKLFPLLRPKVTKDAHIKTLGPLWSDIWI
jgi:hypothetical protein